MTGGYGDDKRKKKIAIISVSSLLLVAMVIAVTVGVILNKSGSSSGQAASGTQGVSTSMKAVQSICQSTDYKQTCIDSLSKANTTDPKELIRTAFKVAMDKISDAAKHSTTLKELEKNKRDSLALETCKELMESAIDDLKSSFEKLGDFDITMLDEMLADLKIWLSATITYQETCLDGFQNTTGKAGEQMRQALRTTSQLTSNGLAMVSEISKVLSSLQLPGISRRLLSDVVGHDEEFPYWFNQGRRNLLVAPTNKIKPNVTVAKDGTGNFTTINAALKHIKKKSNHTFVIYIKAGVYKEYVELDKHMINVMMIGDGPNLTRITGNKNWVDGIPTWQTATFAALGDHFMARDIGFENTAGPTKHQAVALRVQSDHSVFHNCQMDGYQDTLYAHTKRQYYRGCTISGTIDFVFGDAAAVFQNCTFVVRKPLENQRCIVTAQGRNNTRQTTGIVIQNSRITADPEYYPFRNELKAYLGRPWKKYSRTIIMESYIEDLIQPEGWLPWEGNFALKTLFYSEFKNRGPGSLKAGRVKWHGIKRLTAESVLRFTAGNFIKADTWIPATGVPYSSGLINQYPTAVTKKGNSKQHH